MIREWEELILWRDAVGEVWRRFKVRGTPQYEFFSEWYSDLEGDNL